MGYSGTFREFRSRNWPWRGKGHRRGTCCRQRTQRRTGPEDASVPSHKGKPTLTQLKSQDTPILAVCNSGSRAKSDRTSRRGAPIAATLRWCITALVEGGGRLDHQCPHEMEGSGYCARLLNRIPASSNHSTKVAYPGGRRSCTVMPLFPSAGSCWPLFWASRPPCAGPAPHLASFASARPSDR